MYLCMYSEKLKIASEGLDADVKRNVANRGYFQWYSIPEITISEKDINGNDVEITVKCCFSLEIRKLCQIYLFLPARDCLMGCYGYTRVRGYLRKIQREEGGGRLASFV